MNTIRPDLPKSALAQPKEPKNSTSFMVILRISQAGHKNTGDKKDRGEVITKPKPRNIIGVKTGTTNILATGLITDNDPKLYKITGQTVVWAAMESVISSRTNFKGSQPNILAQKFLK